MLNWTSINKRIHAAVPIFLVQCWHIGCFRRGRFWLGGFVTGWFCHWVVFSRVFLSGWFCRCSLQKCWSERRKILHQNHHNLQHIWVGAQNSTKSKTLPSHLEKLQTVDLKVLSPYRHAKMFFKNRSFKRFISTCTLHGIPDAIEENHWLQKLFWFSIVVMTSVITVVQIYSTIIDLSNLKPKTRIEITDQLEMPFPNVRVCELFILPTKLMTRCE